MGVPNPRVYTHTYERPRTHVKHHVVHVRVRWIMVHRNSQHALVCTPEDGMWLPKVAEEFKTVTYKIHDTRKLYYLKREINTWIMLSLDEGGRFFAGEEQWEDRCPWGRRHAFWWLWRPILDLQALAQFGQR